MHDHYILEAPAKLNLRLKVMGRQSNGYHLLEMLNVRLALSDELIVAIHDAPEISVTLHSDSSYKLEVSSADNIISKAAGAFFDAASIHAGLTVVLAKHIPHGAGLGGGSSDAARVLVFLQKYYNNPLSEKAFQEVCLKTGADVPFFAAKSDTLIVKGVGEKIEEVPSLLKEELSGKEVILLIPQFACPTNQVYAQYAELFPVIKSQETCSYDSFVPQIIQNDLRVAAQTLFPKIAQIFTSLRIIPDVISEMSGSGSSFFCIPQSGKELSPALKAAIETAAEVLECKVIHTTII